MITAPSGPIITFGQTQSSTGAPLGQAQETNSQRGPSLFDLGFGMLDPRAFYTYQPGSGVTADAVGFPYGTGIVDYAPTALSSNLLAISSNTQPTAATALTLLSSKTGVTATTIVAPETGRASGSLLCIDSTAAFLAYGSDGTVNYWNPAFGAGRALVITASSSGDRGGFTVAGRDIYGYKVTETLHSTDATRASTGSSGINMTTLKTYKYVSSVIASTTVTSTGVGVGTTDTYGMPFLVSYTGPVNISLAVSSGAAGGDIATTVNPSSANFVFGSTAATATSTTGDPRGTFASSQASGSSARFQFIVRPTALQLDNVTNTSVATLFGVTQFSSV